MTSELTRARQSAAESAEDRIRSYMITHNMHPGDLLPAEPELCEQLGVSRSSVREAMRTLAALDIVTVQQGRGTYVGGLSLEPLVKALAFRGVLSPGEQLAALREVVAVRRYLDRGVADELATAMRGSSNPELDALVRQMVQLAERGQAFPEPDRMFHRLLLSRLGNSLVGQLVEAFWDVHTQVLPQLGVPGHGAIEDTAAAHGDMVRAAEAGDTAALLEAIDRHYAPLQHMLDAGAASAL